MGVNKGRRSKVTQARKLRTREVKEPASKPATTGNKGNTKPKPH